MSWLPLIQYRQATLEPMNVGISRIKMSDYEQHHYDKEIMKQSANALGTIEVNPTSDLESIRVLINKLCDEGPDSPKLSPDWCFIDCEFKLTSYVNCQFYLRMCSQHAPPSAVFALIERRRIYIMSLTSRRMWFMCLTRNARRYRRHRKTRCREFLCSRSSPAWSRAIRTRAKGHLSRRAKSFSTARCRDQIRLERRIRYRRGQMGRREKAHKVHKAPMGVRKAH